jgi:hypothetical protein
LIWAAVQGGQQRAESNKKFEAGHCIKEQKQRAQTTSQRAKYEAKFDVKSEKTVENACKRPKSKRVFENWLIKI